MLLLQRRQKRVRILMRIIDFVEKRQPQISKNKRYEQVTNFHNDATWSFEEFYNILGDKFNIQLFLLVPELEVNM